MAALWLLAITALADTLKLAELAPFPTITVGGVVRLALLLVSEITLELTDALLSVTVQVAEAPDARLEGLHATEVGTTDAVRLTVALAALPLYDAVIVEL